MNKTDLIVRMTERLSGDRTAAVAAVNGVLEEIEGSVARGERVSLTGFGTFERRERAARTARNPRTGEAVQVGASVVPVFRAGTGFRTLLTEAVSGNGSRAAVSPSPAEVAEVPDDGAAKGGKKARKQQAAGKSVAAESKAGKGKDKKEKAGKKAAKDIRSAR
ncbi:HU family DNA-binding protein, partial [Blastococcus sp. URHD0036]|uniref:HU family DNA-binding protein n=1 Tax=Blastococcus sp. URHD0036 TaxID=1380356 RepID=UPI000494F81E